MPASHRFELIFTIAYSSHQVEQFVCYLHLVINWQYSDITSVFLRLSKGAWRSILSGFRCAFLFVVWGAMLWISFAVFTFFQMWSWRTTVRPVHIETRWLSKSSWNWETFKWCNHLSNSNRIENDKVLVQTNRSPNWGDDHFEHTLSLLFVCIFRGSAVSKSGGYAWG